MESKKVLIGFLAFALALAGCGKEPPAPKGPALETISVTPLRLVMSVAQTRQLNAEAKPSEAEFTPAWSSDNSSVATVSSGGLVTAVGVGKTVVKVTCASVKAEIAVDVYEKDIPLTDIEVPENFMVSWDGSAPLGYKLVPENATVADPTFSSDNTSVATVSAAGVVTGVSMGKANITIRNGSILKIVPVTVTIKDFSISPGTFTLNAGKSETKQLAMNATPSTATGIGYVFESSDPDIATVSATGLVTGIANGKATITVKHANLTRSAVATVSGKLLVKVSSKAEGSTAENLVDDNPATVWQSAGNDAQPWVIFGFEAAKTLYGINYWEKPEGDIAASPKSIKVWVGDKGESDSDDWKLVVEANDIADLPAGSRGLARPLVSQTPQTGMFMKVQIVENHAKATFSFLGEIAFIEQAMTLITNAFEWTDVLAKDDPGAGYIHNMVVEQKSGYTHLKTHQNSPFPSMDGLQDPYVFTKPKPYNLTNAKSASIMLEYRTKQEMNEIEGYFFQAGSLIPVTGFILSSRFVPRSEWTAWEMPIPLNAETKLPLDRWRLDLPPRTGRNESGTIYELDVRNVRVVIYE